VILNDAAGSAQDAAVRTIAGVLDASGVDSRIDAVPGASVRDAAERAVRDEDPDATAGELAEPTVALDADATLQDALAELVHAAPDGLPVVDGDGRRVVGWITHLDALRGYTDRVAQEDGRRAMLDRPTGTEHG
jgi:CBS-domain-containing membrane protein